jgi:hypothetical protein
VLTGGSLRGQKISLSRFQKSGPSIDFARFALQTLEAVKSETGVQRERTITSARCALTLKKRLLNLLFAVNYMNPGGPSSIVASVPAFIVRT